MFQFWSNASYIFDEVLVSDTDIIWPCVVLLMYFTCMTAAILLETLCHTWVTSGLSTASTKGKKQFHKELNETEIDKITNYDLAFLFYCVVLESSDFEYYVVNPRLNFLIH